MPAAEPRTAVLTSPDEPEPQEVVSYEGLLSVEALEELDVAVGDTLLPGPDQADQLFSGVDTDVRLAMTGAIRKYMAESPEKFDPRDYLKPAREAAKQICRQHYVEFGCEGQAAKIKAQPLTQVAQRYAKGELAQTVV